MTKEIVLIGGGHTHALVLRLWGMDAPAGVNLTIINPAPTAAYSGMLPGFVAGHYTRDELNIDLSKLAGFAKARLITGIVTAIHTDKKQIDIEGQPSIGYDLCSVDIGITSNMPALPGFTGFGVPAKPLAPFAQRWDDFRTTHRNGKIVVIGAGVAGAELAMAMKHASPEYSVTLLDRSQALTAIGKRGRRLLRRALDDMGVGLMEHADVIRVLKQGVELADGTVVPSDFTVGAAGAEPFAWPSEIGVEMHEGYIAVDAELRTSDPSIYAVGDCAHLVENPRPKAGVFAVREAPYLFENLRAAVTGGEAKSYRPQKDYLKLISLGSKSAMAEKFGFTFQGPLLWAWKDRIDRSFMDQFADGDPKA